MAPFSSCRHSRMWTSTISNAIVRAWMLSLAHLDGRSSKLAFPMRCDLLLGGLPFASPPIPRLTRGCTPAPLQVIDSGSVLQQRVDSLFESDRCGPMYRAVIAARLMRRQKNIVSTASGRSNTPVLSHQSKTLLFQQLRNRLQGINRSRNDLQNFRTLFQACKLGLKSRSNGGELLQLFYRLCCEV